MPVGKLSPLAMTLISPGPAISTTRPAPLSTTITPPRGEHATPLGRSSPLASTSPPWVCGSKLATPPTVVVRYSIPSDPAHTSRTMPGKPLSPTQATRSGEPSGLGRNLQVIETGLDSRDPALGTALQVNPGDIAGVRFQHD